MLTIRTFQIVVKKNAKKKFGLFLDRKTKQKSEQFRKFLCKRIEDAGVETGQSVFFFIIFFVCDV